MKRAATRQEKKMQKKERKSRKKVRQRTLVPLRDRQQWQFKGHKTSRK